MFFGIASVFLKQLEIILLLGYFLESCKFIGIFFVLCNQFCILPIFCTFCFVRYKIMLKNIIKNNSAVGEASYSDVMYC